MISKNYILKQLINTKYTQLNIVQSHFQQEATERRQCCSPLFAISSYFQNKNTFKASCSHQIDQSLIEI